MKKSIIISIVLLIIIFISGFFFIKSDYYSTTSSGFTVKSITYNPNIISDSDISDATFMVDTILDSSSSYLTGTISSSQIETHTQEDVQNSFSIKVSSSDEMIKYDVNNLNIPLYRYTYEYNTHPGWLTDAECTAITNNKVILISEIPVYFFGGDDIICVYKVEEGTFGSIERTSIDFSANLEIDVNNKKISKNINSKDTSVVNFNYDNELIAQAKILGGLVTGDQLPNTANYKAINFGSNWKIIDDYRMTTYNALASALEGDLYQVANTNPQCDVQNKDESDGNACETLIAQMISSTNSAYTEIKNGASYSMGGETISATDDGFNVVMDTRYENTNILWYIKADEIGINIPVAKPTIKNNPKIKFFSGTQGSIMIEIFNNGNDRTSFSYALDDCTNFEEVSSSSTNTVSIDSKTTEVVYLKIMAQGLNENLKESCYIKVTNVNDPSLYDTKVVPITLEQATSCTPNTEVLVGKCVYECTSSGQLATEPKICCLSTPILSSVNNYVCEDDTNIVCDEGETLKDGKCIKQESESTFNIISIMLILIGLVGGILATVFFNKQFGKSMNKSIKYIINTLVFIIVFIFVVIVGKALFTVFMDSIMILLIAGVIGLVVAFLVGGLFVALSPKLKYSLMFLIFIIISAVAFTILNGLKESLSGGILGLIGL